MQILIKLPGLRLIFIIFNMILKFLSLRASIRPLHSSRFFFANQPRYNANRGPFMIEDCRTYSQLAQNLPTLDSLEQNTINRYCDVIDRIKNNPNNTRYHLMKILSLFKQIDINSQPITLVANLCAASAVGTDLRIWIKSFNNLLENKIKAILLDPESRSELSTWDLLKMMKFQIKIRAYGLVGPINEELQARLDTLKVSELREYLNVMSMNRMPDRREKQFYDKVVERVLAMKDNLAVNPLISIYCATKNVNPHIYRVSTLARSVEESLKEKMNEFEERNIFSILDFTSKSNAFIDIIVKKILDTIAEDGTSVIDSYTIIKILNKCSSFYNVKNISQEESSKLLKFIDRNSNFGQWVGIITNNFFSNQQLREIQESFQRQNLFQSDPVYLFELLRKNITFSPDEYLSNLSAPGSNRYEFLHLIILKKFSETSSEAKQYMEQYVEYLKDPKQKGFRMLQLLSSCRPEITEIFHKNFASLVEEKYLEVNEPAAKDQYFLYLFLANDFSAVQKILREGDNDFNQKVIGNIIDKCTESPTVTRTRLPMMFELLSQVELNDRNVSRFVAIMMDWNLHARLNQQEVLGLIKVSTKVMNALDEQPTKAAMIASYVVFSPNRLISTCREYPQFLAATQDKILECRDKAMLRDMAIEFKFNNVMNKAFAENVLKMTSEKDLETYYRLVCEQEQDLTQLDIRPHNVATLVKFARSEQEIAYLKDNEEQLKACIDKMTTKQIDEALLGFNLTLAYRYGNLLGFMLEKYSQLENYRFIKADAIIQKFSTFKYRSNEMSKFIESLGQHYEKNFWHLPLSSVEAYLNVCSRCNLKATPEIEKIISNLEPAFKKSWDVSTLIPLTAHIYALKPEASPFFLSNTLSKVSKRQIGQFTFSQIIRLALYKQLPDSDIKSLQDMLKHNSNKKIEKNYAKYLAHSYPALSEQILKLKNSDPIISKRVKLFDKILTELNAEGKISLTIKEEGGRKLYFVDNHAIYFDNSELRVEVIPKYREFLSIIFDLGANFPPENIHVLFTRSSYRFCYKYLVDKIEKFSGMEQEFEAKLGQHKKDRLEESDIEVEEDNKSQ